MESPFCTWRRTYGRGCFTNESVAQTQWTSRDSDVSLSLTTQSGIDYSVIYRTADTEEFISAELTGNTAVLPISKGALAEVRVMADDGSSVQYNTYYVDRSEDTASGYFYRSANNTVEAYVRASTNSSYTWIGDNTVYTYGDYVSVNQATISAATTAQVSTAARSILWQITWLRLTTLL